MSSSHNQHGSCSTGASGTSRGKGKRGRTMMPDIVNLRTGQRIKVPVNEYGQPCDQDPSPKIEKWIGTLAKNPHLFPFKCETWKKVSQQSKEDGWKKVEEKFELPITLKKWVLKKLNDGWKDYKYEMTRFESKFLEKDKEMEDLKAKMAEMTDFIQSMRSSQSRGTQR